MKHPDELADYILTLPGVKERGVTKRALLYEASEMKQLLLPNVVEMGHISEARWQDILDIYKGLNLVAKDKTLKGFIYNKEKANEENLLERALIAIGITFVIVGILFAYSITLKRAVKKRTKELEVEIIQRKKQEAGLEKMSHELLARNNELQQFAYLTSHNLRAPVTNLRTLIKLFDKNSLSDRNKLFFDKIEFSVNNFNQMLSDLNEILSARKTEVITYKTLDFTAELQHVLQSIGQTVAEEDLKVSHDFSQQSKINCSPVVIQSVLLNLITNAIKYKKPGTHPEIFLQTILSGEFLVLKVTDKGVGINLHKHGEKIFTPYQRFHPTVEGKGLGLYLIKTQIEKMGGHITLESEENVGTTFNIYFKQNSDHAGSSN
jgi:signal transduction histidine kinase